MHGSELSAAEALYLLDLAETTFRAPDLPNLAESFLGSLARLIQTPSAILYLRDPALPADSFFQMGLRARNRAHRSTSMCRAIPPGAGQGRLATGAGPPEPNGGRPSFPVSPSGPQESNGAVGSGDAGA